MSFIQNFYTSRDNNTDGNTYVGQEGRLWYNPLTNSIYVNTANVVGGTPVALATGANITATNITVNTITSTTGNVNVTGNLVISGNISPAAAGKIGGITPGPGVVISNEGELTIDTANLPLSFGNFTANNNVLTIVNADEDMILVTQGNAEIQLVGNVGFYKPNGIPPDPNNLFFFARDDGQLRIFVPAEDPLEGGVEIIGSATGNYLTPGAAGAMLQLTGNPGLPCRFYVDGNDDYASIVGRRFNGNVAVPTQVLANEYVLRINATAATNGGMGNVALAQMQFQALEDQTTTAQGSAINFLVTPIGQIAANRVEVANITVANGVNATKFTTSGNIDGDNLNLTGNIVADYVVANNVGSTGNVEIESNNTYWYFTTDNRFVGNGNIESGNIVTSGLISATGNITAGNVNSFVTLPAGTAAQSPLVFAAGNIQIIPPTAGSMSYDGTVFYATPQDAERGLMVTEQIYIPNADYTLLNQTAVQSMFGVSVSLSSGTRYAYRLLSVIYKTANNISLQYATSGNLVLAKHSYQTTSTAAAALATLSTPSIVRNILTTGFDTPVTVSAALNGTGYYSLTINGTLNVTTGGTWTPLVAFTGLPGTGSYLAAGSSIEIWPIGPTGANVSIGNWT